MRNNPNKYPIVWLEFIHIKYYIKPIVDWEIRIEFFIHEKNKSYTEKKEKVATNTAIPWLIGSSLTLSLCFHHMTDLQVNCLFIQPSLLRTPKSLLSYHWDIMAKHRSTFSRAGKIGKGFNFYILSQDHFIIKISWKLGT